MEKCDETQLETRLKIRFWMMTHLSNLGLKKTRFSVTKPHFQPIYPQNFKRMNNLSSEAHGTEKCDESQLSHT